MRSRRGLLALVTAASSLGLVSEARAYTVRNSPSGEPVRWPTATVDVVIDATLASVDATAASAVAGAFGTWNAVSGAETPGVITREGVADEVGYRPAAGDNRNTVRYADKGSEIAGGALAVTVLTFGDDGSIFDADVILNGGGSRKFGVLAEADADTAGVGTGGDKNRYDVQNVLTHEVGHFFGLGEEQALADATMFVTSARGETKKRDLTSDDELGVRSLYVPGSLAAAEEAAAAAGACAAGRGAGGAVPGAIYALAGALIAAAWQRARSRRLRLGTGGAAVALLALAGPVGCGGIDTDQDRDLGGDALATVTATSSRWRGGLIVTRLTVKTVECHLDECPDESTIEVLGGTALGFTQIVGHHAVPLVGAAIPLVLRDGQARWLHGLAARHTDPDRRAPSPTPTEEERRAAPTTLPSKTKTADPRRAHDRAPMHLGVRLVSDGTELHGTTENISEGGLFVAVDELAPGAAQGSEIEVLLEVPGREQPLRAVGEVRWVRTGDEAQPAGVGIRFVELEGEDAAAIRDLVEQEELTN